MRYIIKDYIPLTVPKSIDFKEINGIFMIEINGAIVTSISECLIKSKINEATPVYIRKDECQAVRDTFMSHNKTYPHVVKNFEYNGFTGQMMKGIAPYRAKFVNWTGDPGIARMLCSDGRVRLIPTFALKGGEFSLPYDNTNKKMFSNSL